jgi:outer membrane protein assembly factor BamB
MPLRFIFIITIIIITISICLSASPTWTQWQGLNRDSISTETGLLKEWPEGGPALLWTAEGCGKGYSSVAVTEKMIYTAGTMKNQTFVMAFDMAGKMKWKTVNGEQWKPGATMFWAASYDGARATPTVDNGIVYHLNDLGLLSALDAENGKLKWSANLPKQFESKWPDFGYTESVLIDGNKLICYPGGKKGYMTALNKKTGAVIWSNKDIGDNPAFASPIIFTDQGIRQVVTMTEEAIIGVAADTGKLLWRYPFTNKRKNNIPTPIYSKGYVFTSTGYGGGSVLLKLNAKGDKVSVDKVWQNTLLDNIHGGVILRDGYLYGSSNEKPAWFCLDFLTGEEKYRDKSIGQGSLMYADGMIYCLGERGTMLLVPCTPKEFKPTGRFDVPKGGTGLYWSHPVVCNGRLYLRHDDKLFVYNIAKK